MTGDVQEDEVLNKKIPFQKGRREIHFSGLIFFAFSLFRALNSFLCFVLTVQNKLIAVLLGDFH